MWVELPPVWVVMLNVVIVPTVHLGVSWAYQKMPRSRFCPDSWLHTKRSWEREGRLYQSLFGVRRWKAMVPDAAPWFNGFAKKDLRSRDIRYLEDFRAETCRGESAHYAQIVALLVTLIWNPWPVAAIVMVVYAFASNLPCIIVQRYTRHRLAHLIERIGSPFFSIIFSKPISCFIGGVILLTLS